MWRYVIALGALAAVAAPAAAQVDSGGTARAPRGYNAPRITYSITSKEGWLGIGVACNRCSLTANDDGDARRWTFSEPPTVFTVDQDGPADRAGLRTGDTLVAIDGVPLTSSRGGAAFANIRPGQAVRLTYRRYAEEREVGLVAQAHPVNYQVGKAMQAMRRAQEMQEHTLESSREQLERSRATLDQVREQMRQQLEEAQSRRDSATVDQVERLQRVLEEQQRVLARTLEERATLEAREWPAPAPVAAVPATPAPVAEPAIPGEPAPAAVPAAPAAPAAPAIAPTPPMSYREHRRFGPLRYTGRLGDVVIEARGPGGVTATEVSDNEVVITSGDLSVRLALLPRAAPRAEPPPAQTPRPPQD